MDPKEFLQRNMQTTWEKKGKHPRNRCECCRVRKKAHNSRKEPRNLLRQMAHGKKPRWEPFHSSHSLWHDPEMRERIRYIEGLNSWRKTLRRKNGELIKRRDY